MNKIKKGDEVIVIAGKDKGKQGVVLKIAAGRIIVENVNIAKRHTKGNPQAGVAGGIIEKEMPMDISNIAIYNPLTQKADRVGVRTLEDGRKVRFFKSNSEVIDI